MTAMPKPVVADEAGRGRVPLTVLPEQPAAPAAAYPRLAAPVAREEGDPFNPHKALNHFDRLLGIAQGRLVSPVTVEIDPTNVCNHRCQWCVSAEAHTGEQLGLDVLRSLLGQLRKYDVKSVVLKGGGEPTAHPDILEILEACRASGLAVGMITNGSMPRPGTVQKVAEVAEWARVSLDAATAETHQRIHGTRDFARIVRNVGRLVAGGGETMVGLNFVAEPRNMEEMPAFARLGRELGVAYVTIRCVFDPANPLDAGQRQRMRELAEAARAEERPGGGFRVFLGNFTDRYLSADSNAPFPYARCLGPNLVGIVGGTGDVYACCFLRGDARFSFGNVHEQRFDEIWSSQRRKDVMEAVYRGECGRACAGGMTANRYNTYNEILNYLAAEEKRHAAFA